MNRHSQSVDSSKNLSELSDDEFIQWIYNQFLSREPDAEGKQHYLSVMAEGESRIDIIQNILTSEEIADLPKEFVTAGHFYSTIPNLKNIQYAVKDPGPLKTIGGVDMQAESQLALLNQLAPYYRQLPISDFAARKRLYYYPNGSYPIGDASVLMCLIAHLEAKQLIEIGCGNSSCAVREANEIFLDGNLDITSVEPYPKLFLSLIPKKKRSKTNLITTTIQGLDISIFDKLNSGDILFIDTTHVSKVVSDVNRIFFEILPRLKSGVCVHIHDVFYPFEYPEKWFDKGRFWTEQYLLQAFLQYNSAFEILIWPQYLIHNHFAELEATMPLVATGGGCSMWLRRK